MIRLPIRSCSYLYVTWQVTRPLPPGAQCSVDTWRSEDRNNPRNSGNAKAEYNVLLTLQLFPTQKRKSWRKLPATENIFRCRVCRVERRLSKLRKLCKLHTFTFFFSFAIRFRLEVILIPVYTHSQVLRLSWPSIFSNDYRYQTQTQLTPESNTSSQDRASVCGFIHQEKWAKYM